jgi:uncharacterized protein (DUF1330 family)
MKPVHMATLALLVGVTIGGATIHGLHAQIRPQVYLITEVDVTNADIYTKEYGPPAAATVRAAGGRYLVSGGKSQAFDGEPPKRISVVVWENMDQLQAWRESADWKALGPVREKAAKFRSFAIEGLPQ